MSFENLEQQTQQLAQNFLGRELRPLHSTEQIVAGLDRSQVMLIFAEHQLVATEARDGRIVFFNPAASEAPPGTMLPADRLPERRVEEEPGEESSSLTSLQAWLCEGRVRAFELV